MPITSLTFIELQGQQLLIACQGPILSVHSLSNNSILLQHSLFDSQTIHGVKCLCTPSSSDDREHLRLLVWGGREVAQAELQLSPPTVTTSDVPLTSIAASTSHFCDWSLDVEWAGLPDGLPATAFALTAHNEVLQLKSESSSTLELEFLRVASGPKSMLYSAQIKPLSASSVLVCAGTVFGEVILWTCEESHGPDGSTTWVVSPARMFHGHQGSIFGVCIFPSTEMGQDGAFHALVAACSDDRTIRIWPFATSLQPGGLDTPKGELQRNQQEADENPEEELASAWGHISRIWGVKILGSLKSMPDGPWHLISRGEDATCQLWRLSKNGSSDARLQFDEKSGEKSDRQACSWQLQHVNSDRYHSGKHIWSFTVSNAPADPVVFTGGSDGGIISRQLSLEGSSAYQDTKVPYGDVPRLCLSGPKDAFREYAFISESVLLVTTASGRLLRGDISPRIHAADQPLEIMWTLVPGNTEPPSLVMLASNQEADLTYVVSSRGIVWLYQLETSCLQLIAQVNEPIATVLTCSLKSDRKGSKLSYLLSISPGFSRAHLLETEKSGAGGEDIIVSRSIRLQLPAPFQPTSILVLNDGGFVALGSRSGGLAIYLHPFNRGNSEHVPPSSYVRHIHGSDAVSHLSCLDEEDDMRRVASGYHILSTGRDGSYAIHKIAFETGEENMANPRLATLHRSFPPMGPNLEGAHIIRSDSGKVELELHGFKSTNFVVWNETTHQKVLEVDFGGAQRNWTYKSPSSQPTSNSGRLLVWTRSSTCHLRRYHRPTHHRIKSGGHGREIKAAAISDRLFACRGDGFCRLLATGAEDAAIRLWLVPESMTETTEFSFADSLSCLHILKKHTAGIQHLDFCEDYLFSSSGCEELYIWKLSFDVPVVRIGVTLVATLPKHIPDSDLRITSFRVIHAEAFADFLIYAVYSNSMIRVFSCSLISTEQGTKSFQLVYESHYNTTCLLQIATLSSNPSIFITASTNGAIAAWHKSITTTTPSTNPATSIFLVEHFIHQNAILALETTEMTPEIHLISTGGDDNALGITLALTDNNSNSPRFATLLLPDAHAAAITAIQTIHTGLDSFCGRSRFVAVLATTGNDQRVKVWQVSVNLHALTLLRTEGKFGDWGKEVKARAVEAVSVKLLRQCWTTVADVGAMVLVPGPEGHLNGEGRAGEHIEDQTKSLMIVGIGMEMLRVDITPELQLG